MSKRKREPAITQLREISDELAPIIAFVRVLGRVSQAEDGDDSGLWLALEITGRLERIEGVIARLRQDLTNRD